MIQQLHSLVQGRPAETVMNWVVLPALLLLAMLPHGLVAATADPDSPTVSYMIVVTGGELLTGKYPDGHTHFITSTLRPLGLECAGSMCVDDKEKDLKEAIRHAQSKTKLIIVTGGLGPTPNDITRETLSKVTGIKLAEHPDVLRDMERRFGRPASKIRENLRQQTQTPVRGTYFENQRGTAVGLVFEPDDSVVIALPGPPHELQPMVHNEMIGYLNRRFGTRLPGHSMTLRFVGLGQSQIDQLFDDKVPLPSDVTVSSTFEGGRVDFSFSLPDDTAESRARLEALKQKILKHLGDNVYADTDVSLEDVVLGLLKGQKVKLALVELGSGGSLAAALNGAETASEVMRGAYVASNLEMLSHMLDYPQGGIKQIERLTETVAARTNAECVVVVGEAQEGSGGRFAEVAFRMPDKTIRMNRLSLGGGGEMAQQRLTTRLLDQLRRSLRNSQEKQQERDSNDS